MTDASKGSRAWPKFRFELFKGLFHLMALGVIGLGLFPSLCILYFFWHGMAGFAPWIKLLGLSLLLPPAYFCFGLALVMACVLFKTILRLNIRPGLYRLYEDWEVIKWMGYNAFILIVNACFLDGFRVSPFQTFFYRAMGAKVGKGAQINTAGLADLSLIQIGENTIIGGGTTLICHVARGGHLKLAPVKIGNRVSIGLGTVIMPGTEIGDDAVISPRSLVPVDTKIPPRGRFGGDPLQDLRKDKKNRIQEGVS